MAEGPTTYSGQRVDELLRCPICLDRYNNPKILPCQHTFCISPCLQGLVDFRSRILRCPECRAEHALPRNGAGGFPNNLIISNFLDLQPQPAAPAGGSGAAAPGGETQRGDSNKCGVCEKEAQTSKCAHCNKMVCPNCHKSHVTQLKFDIGRLVNQIRRGLPKLSESIAQTEQKSESVKQHVEAVKSEVRDVVARYIKQLRDREKLLNSELDTFLQGEARNLRLKQENIEVELASVSSYCDSTEGLLNRTGENIPDTELVALKDQCAQYMEQIRNAEISSELSTKLVKLEVEGQRINTAISNFGSLVVTTPGTSRGNGGSNPSTRSVGNQRATRQRWSSPQPLHELYTRDSNTPPPTTPPMGRPPVITPSPVTAQRSRPNASVHSIGIGPQNQHLLPSYLRSTQNRPSPSPAPSSNINTNRYMYRMATSPDDALQSLEQFFRADDNNIGQSPRQGRISAIFGSYTPETEDRTTARQNDRSPGLIGTFQRGTANLVRGQNRSNIQVAPVNNSTNNENSHLFSGRDTYSDIDGMDISAAPPQPNIPQPEPLDQRDNRQAIAFSVDFDEGPTRRGRRRQPPRNRGRNANRRSQNVGNRERSQNQSEPQPSSSTNNTQRSGQTAEVPRAVPLTRNRTFIMDETEAANSNTNNNNNTDVDVARPNIDTININDELDTVDVEMLPDETSSSDSLTVTRPQINYKRKGQVRKVIGGSRGSEPGKFTWPRGVAISPRNDSIVVADSSNHRIQVFDCNGDFVTQFGTFGTLAGQFDCLAGVACNRNGDIIASDRYNHRIQVFDRYGDLKKTFGREGIGHGQLSYPWGVATDNTGNMYVVDKENHRVQVFSSQGDFIRVFGTFGEEPGHFNHPSYIAIAPDSKIVVADTDNHRVQVFSPEGEYLHSIGSHGSEVGHMQNPKGVAVDKQGFIIVADSGNNRIQIFRGDGRHFTSFGSHGNANSQFKAIEGVAMVNDGKLVVCDKENHRLQIF